MVGQLTRPQSESERFMGALKESGPTLGKAFETAMKPQREAEKQEAENKRLKELTGKDYSGLSPDVKQLLLKGEMGAKGKGGQDLSMASNALNEMEQMISGEGIGLLGGNLNPSDKARFNRGKFDALQSSLMPLFKSMFPRGMTEREFKFVNEKYIPQTGDSESTIRGKIDGLKRLMATQGGDMSGNLLSGGEGKEMAEGGGEEQTTVFRDSKGNAYDIPASVAKKHADKLKAQGLTAG